MNASLTFGRTLSVVEKDLVIGKKSDPGHRIVKIGVCMVERLEQLKEFDTTQLLGLVNSSIDLATRASVRGSLEGSHTANRAAATMAILDKPTSPDFATLRSLMANGGGKAANAFLDAYYAENLAE